MIFPGTIFPSLNSGDDPTAWVFRGVPNNDVVQLTYPDDASGVQRTIDAVSAVFMHEGIMNEYVTTDLINAATEWVVTFPTKNFYVDPLRMVQAGFYADVPAAVAGGAHAPFTALYHEHLTAGDMTTPRKCEAVFLEVWDREEASPSTPDTPVGVRPPVVSPSGWACDGPAGDVDPRCQDPVAPFQICNEVNILRFGERRDADGNITAPGRTVFDTPDLEGTGDTLVYQVYSPYSDGWAKLDLGGPNRVDANGLVGLPVTGFAAQEYENNFLDDGVKANYGGLFQHKGNVRQNAVPSVPPVVAPPTP